jgi:hypothetical protein
MGVLPRRCGRGGAPGQGRAAPQRRLAEEGPCVRQVNRAVLAEAIALLLEPERRGRGCLACEARVRGARCARRPPPAAAPCSTTSSTPGAPVRRAPAALFVRRGDRRGRGPRGRRVLLDRRQGQAHQEGHPQARGRPRGGGGRGSRAEEGPAGALARPVAAAPRGGAHAAADGGGRPRPRAAPRPSSVTRSNGRRPQPAGALDGWSSSRGPVAALAHSAAKLAPNPTPPEPALPPPRPHPPPPKPPPTAWASWRRSSSTP